MPLPLYELRNRPPAGENGPPRPRWLKHLAWILPLLIFDVWLIGRWRAGCAARRAPPPPEPAEPAVVQPLPEVRPVPWVGLVYPTAQPGLLETAAAFQPTASGNPESALYGSVRTGSRGGRLVPTFHEGLDIAALQRDRRGRPMDAVVAVANGRVVHANRFGGNSNYGVYVVVLHEDPMGGVFTLYAHLMNLAPGIKPGVELKAGEPLGVMGNTSSSPIPMARGHVHFEIGLMLNSHFAAWFRAQKLKPDHGNYHGWNLLGLDPLAFLRFQKERPGAPFADFLQEVKPAFEIMLAARDMPDFFRRYPALWTGESPSGALVLTCSDNGVPLRGRAATAEERDRLGREKALVLGVDETVLGRNGARLLARRESQWLLAQAGEQWREILLYPQDIR